MIYFVCTLADWLVVGGEGVVENCLMLLRVIVRVGQVHGQWLLV